MFNIKIIFPEKLVECTDYEEYIYAVELEEADESLLIKLISDVITDQDNLKIILTFCDEEENEQSRGSASTYLSEFIACLEEVYMSINIKKTNFQVEYLDQGYDMILKFSRINLQNYSLKCIDAFKYYELGKGDENITVVYLNQILSDLYKDFCFLAKRITPLFYRHKAFQGWLKKMQTTTWRVL